MQMISSGELRLLLAVVIVLVTGVGIGVILDHYGTPTVVYVHKYAPDCPKPMLGEVKPLRTPQASRTPWPRAPALARPHPDEKARVDQIFVDLVAHDAMQVLQRVVFVGTGGGWAALSLARGASYRCRLVALDEQDGRLHEVKEEWATLGDAAMPLIRPIRGSGRALVEELLADDGRSPLLVVASWMGENSFAEEVLLGMAPHLPDSSVVVVPRKDWEELSEEVEIRMGDSLVTSTIRVDERFRPMAAEMGAALVALKVEHDLLPDFDRGLLPPWSGMGQVALQTPRRNSMYEWIVFARLQKTASKTIEGFLQSKARNTRCGRRFLVSPPYDNRYCASNELCSPENFASAVESQRGYCHVVSGHHCDWDDLMHGLWRFRPDEMRMVTGVREPTARVKSEFKHVHGSHLKAWDYCPSAEGGPTGKFSKESFIDFFSEEQNAWGMVNRQTRMLAGCGTTERCGLTDEELLERAKQHVLQAHVLTIAERLSESVLLTAYEFAWDVAEFPIVSDSRNMAETLDWDIDEELASLILTTNGLDASLVEFCNAVMDARIQQFKEILAATELPTLVCDESSCHMENEALLQWDAFVQ